MDISFIIASVLGYIGLVLLFVQVVFGSRHVFSFFTDDTVKVNKMHKYIGIYGTLFVFLHPILEMWIRTESVVWIIMGGFATESQLHITFGRVAVLLLLIVWVTSAVVRDKMKWRPWKYLHLLAYPIVFLSFIHVKDLGTFFEFYPALQFVWFAMFMIFIISVLWRLVTWSGVTKAKYVLKSRTLVGDDIVLITLTPTTKLLTSKIGQHFYLQAKSFGSEHPFTIIRNEDGVLSFGIRRVGGFWNEILQKSLGEVVNVDGPYGVFTKEAQNTNPKVIISAGIGVTPFIDLVEDFGENTIYFNCNRSATQIIEREVLKNNSSTYIDILDDATGAAPGEVLSGKITKEVLQNKLEDRVAHLPYFVCGSPGFIKYIQSVLTELGVPKQKIYYEELGF